MRHANALALAAFVVVLGGCGRTGVEQGSRSGGAASHTVQSIQGNGRVSPVDGETVQFDGIVTGDFQQGAGAHGDLGGFFVQSESPGGNASAGIFVFDGDNPRVDVTAGDRVRIDGRVTEFFGETQVRASNVAVTGRGRIDPLDVELPGQGTVENSDGSAIADLEHYEGMLVRLPAAMTVDNLRDLERFGELTLSAGRRPRIYTQFAKPDIDAYSAHQQSVAARSIRLDDGRRAQNLRPARFAAGGVVRAGDQTGELIGNLRYSRGSGESGFEGWRLVPVEHPSFTRMNPRPAAPTVDGAMRIAVFNVENYFASAEGGNTCGPRGESRCRGADTDEELARQRARTGATLSMMDADIVGVVEVENDGDDGALADLVAALNARSAAAGYAYLATGPIGGDSIRVALIYRSSTVSPAGPFAVLGSAADSRYDDSRNRPALAQTFEHETAGPVTVVVTHLKSKGSSCAKDGDPNVGDGQGNCNLTRTRAAAALADWAMAGPTGHGRGDIVVIGDLNAYAREDPIAALEQRGLVNLVRRDHGVDAYSYLFSGQAGTLDYALATQELAARIIDVTVWHINADEAGIHDYNLEFGREPALFDGDMPYRSSDHDPVIIGIAAER